MANQVNRQTGHDPRPNWSAREIARRNRKSLGAKLSPVMKTAATARELAHGPAAEKAPDSKPRTR